MALLLTVSELNDSIRYYLHKYWIDTCDPRTKNLMLMNDGPWTLISILFLYVILVTKVMPQWMRNRKPYDIRGLMICYNILMVVINGYFLFRSVIWLNWGSKLMDFKFPSPEDRSPETMSIVTQFHIYFLTKFVDFLDTFFFVLRKKQSQITSLHIYHHISVPIIGWISCWTGPTMPVLGLFSVMNCFVHVIMYSYYALSALGPEVQQYLWWKRYITMVQLTQFVILTFYSWLLMTFEIGYPIIYKVLPLFQPPMFFVMFYNFYKRSYLKKLHQK